MYLLRADVLVGRLAALCHFLNDLVPLVLKLCDRVLNICSTVELLGTDTVLQCLFGLHDPHLHLCELWWRWGHKQKREVIPQVKFTPEDSCQDGKVHFQ